MRVNFATTSDKPSFKHRPKNRRDGWGTWESRVLEFGEGERMRY